MSRMRPRWDLSRRKLHQLYPGYRLPHFLIFFFTSRSLASPARAITPITPFTYFPAALFFFLAIIFCFQTRVAGIPKNLGRRPGQDPYPPSGEVTFGKSLDSCSPPSTTTTTPIQERRSGSVRHGFWRWWGRWGKIRRSDHGVIRSCKGDRQQPSGFWQEEMVIVEIRRKRGGPVDESDLWGKREIPTNQHEQSRL
ncbi:hypothetical protein B0T21DRAFT_133746 [Apiosordaria backusii]|uniref:Uncharacterized protein n=1 Tax=Apiosordaria backusii TaxID=314023 RepID=A0AA39ZPB8_9PEZI|nr:hypothetical protein B0T21DRAFT_133746 [Apiosordaria backusii]